MIACTFDGAQNIIRYLRGILTYLKQSNIVDIFCMWYILHQLNIMMQLMHEELDKKKNLK